MRLRASVLACAFGLGLPVGAVVVPPERIREAAEAYVRSQLPVSARDVQVTFRTDATSVELPSADARCEVASRARVNWSGPFGVPVRIVGTRGEERIVHLTAEISAVVDALVLSQPVDAGAPIAPSDVTRSARALGSIPRDAILEVDELAGRTAAQRIARGALLTRGHLVRPALVRAGDAVTLIVRRSALEVSMPGVALSGGRLGDTIRVRNQTSRKVIEGRIVGPGQVEASGPVDEPKR